MARINKNKYLHHLNKSTEFQNVNVLIAEYLELVYFFIPTKAASRTNGSDKGKTKRMYFTTVH